MKRHMHVGRVDATLSSQVWLVIPHRLISLDMSHIIDLGKT